MVAERVGFEPTVQLPVHMISSHADSAGLSHLSEKVRIAQKLWPLPLSNQPFLCYSKVRENHRKSVKYMEQTGFEPVTSSVRGMRSPN